MAPMDETTKYDLDSVGVPEDDDFVLEDILAEYGGGRARKLMRDVEEELHPLEKLRPKPFEPLPPTPKEKRTTKKTDQPEPPAEPELPRPPSPITLEQMVGSTVEAVISCADGLPHTAGWLLRQMRSESSAFRAWEC